MSFHSSVGRIIAVTSCKGGVGKSTVSLNLALRLASRGHRVGLFDADVFGPSLPAQMPSVTGKVATAEGGWAVAPFEHSGLRVMSVGWLQRSWAARAGGEVRTGHRPGALALQLLNQTAWGDLDFLVVDSPPGTGDVPHALYSAAPLAGAVVVTTPSSLAVADVVRGVGMLERFKVPRLALVENMASFRCGCGTEHFPFGRSHATGVAAALGAGVPLVSLPVVPDAMADEGGGAVTEAAATVALAPHFDRLAASLEGSTAGVARVSLPHGLVFSDRAHWPTVMAVADIA